MGMPTFRRGRSQSERLRRNSRGQGGELGRDDVVEAVFACVSQGPSVRVIVHPREPGLPWLPSAGVRN